MTDPTDFLTSSPIVQTTEVAELYAAFAVAFGELHNVATDSEATVRSDKGNYSYKYMSLGSIVGSVREPLSKNGLAIIQVPSIARSSGGLAVEVTTRLLHKSGQWVEGTVSIGVAASTNAQGIGSAITYGRRYGICAMLGIASGDDDDGAAASSAPPSTGYDDDIGIAGAKSVIFEAVGKDRHMAALWWEENIDAGRRGPFPMDAVVGWRDAAVIWLEELHVLARAGRANRARDDVDASVAAHETAGGGAEEPLRTGDSPPAPEDDSAVAE